MAFKTNSSFNVNAISKIKKYNPRFKYFLFDDND